MKSANRLVLTLLIHAIFMLQDTCSNPAPTFVTNTDQIQSLFLSFSRHTCSQFLWNPMSFAKHRMCNHLIKGKIEEGKYGRKYVRIAPGSILSMLYPCKQWGPDRCLICGQSLEDHMRKSWQRKKKRTSSVSAYDDYLDKVLYDAATSGSDYFQFEADCIYYNSGMFEIHSRSHQQHHRKGTNKSRQRSDEAFSLEKGRPLNFHLRYLKNIVESGDDLSDTRKIMPLAFYRVPRARCPSFGPKGFIRRSVLRKMDKMIRTQTLENFKRWESM